MSRNEAKAIIVTESLSNGSESGGSRESSLIVHDTFARGVEAFPQPSSTMQTFKQAMAATFPRGMEQPVSANCNWIRHFWIKYQDPIVSATMVAWGTLCAAYFVKPSEEYVEDHPNYPKGESLLLLAGGPGANFLVNAGFGALLLEMIYFHVMLDPLLNALGAPKLSKVKKLLLSMLGAASTFPFVLDGFKYKEALWVNLENTVAMMIMFTVAISKLPVLFNQIRRKIMSWCGRDTESELDAMAISYEVLLQKMGLAGHKIYENILLGRFSTPTLTFEAADVEDVSSDEKVKSPVVSVDKALVDAFRSYPHLSAYIQACYESGQVEHVMAVSNPQQFSYQVALEVVSYAKTFTSKDLPTPFSPIANKLKYLTIAICALFGFSTAFAYNYPAVEGFVDLMGDNPWLRGVGYGIGGCLVSLFTILITVTGGEVGEKISTFIYEWYVAYQQLRETTGRADALLKSAWKVLPIECKQHPFLYVPMAICFSALCFMSYPTAVTLSRSTFLGTKNDIPAGSGSVLFNISQIDGVLPKLLYLCELAIGKLLGLNKGLSHCLKQEDYLGSKKYIAAQAVRTDVGRQVAFFSQLPPVARQELGFMSEMKHEEETSVPRRKPAKVKKAKKAKDSSWQPPGLFSPSERTPSRTSSQPVHLSRTNSGVQGGVASPDFLPQDREAADMAALLDKEFQPKPPSLCERLSSSCSIS